MIKSFQKDVQTKLTKSLLDMIVLQYLNHENMCGYQLITKIQKGFAVNFGPSKIYPLLRSMEKKGYIKGIWESIGEKQRKIFALTNEGKNVLNFSESMLNIIFRNIENENQIQTQVAIDLDASVRLLALTPGSVLQACNLPSQY
jgi:PadR family transcriptional regulator PadR